MDSVLIVPSRSGRLKAAESSLTVGGSRSIHRDQSEVERRCSLGLGGSGATRVRRLVRLRSQVERWKGTGNTVEVLKGRESVPIVGVCAVLLRSEDWGLQGPTRRI